MGREAIAICDLNGEIAEVKVLLESTEIIVRGALRARIPRADIEGWIVDNDILEITAGEQRLRIDFGSNEAKLWAVALSKPIPTLAQKLGVDTNRRAYVVGQVEEVELELALLDGTASEISEAAMIIAILMTEMDLINAVALARSRPNCPIWCVHGKGKSATVKDGDIRSAMRAAGFSDSKTSGISDKMTATRYLLKKAG